MRKFVAAGLLALGVAGIQAPLGAQSGVAGDLQCTGKRVAIRYSEIKPGQIETFKKAVAAHNAWYAAGKNGTRTTLIRVIKRSGDKTVYDDGAAMTMTVYDTKPQPPRDAAYAAFVKLYTDSSDVKEEHRGCMGG
ncbi:MAG: hypothetical protein A4S16_01215 [Proteobacteria bacterium SG_bin6]|nr:MAG: hypothetical protein A4S16_01215 [Proteobacteria bacterium SG_bin6]